MYNKKDKAFLLVELRIAIQKDSYLLSRRLLFFNLDSRAGEPQVDSINNIF
jgi:hypothetical protein